MGTKRLNDDEWKTILSGNNRTEYLPEWLKDIYGTTLPWTTPEYNIVALVSVMTITVALAIIKKITRTKRQERTKH